MDTGATDSLDRPPRAHDCSSATRTEEEEDLRHLDEAPATAPGARTHSTDSPGEHPVTPSPDQTFFNESLRAGVRTLGDVVRDRKKKK